MGNLGSELRSAREKRNISLAQLAAITRINPEYLKYLEEGRYQHLPGGMYNRAFLKAYCEAVELDAKEMLQQYEAEYSFAPPKLVVPKNKMRSQRTGGSRPNPVIAWTIMLLLSATGLFFSRKWIASVFSPYFSHATAPQQLARKDSPPSRPVPALMESSTSGFQTKLDTAELAVTSNADKSSDNITPTEELARPLRLDIEVTEECWLSINSDGRPAVRRLLEPGEIRSFGASEQFVIVIGNAGGVRLKINGKLAKPLGKSGDVVKVLINDKNLEEFIDQNTG